VQEVAVMRIKAKTEILVPSRMAARLAKLALLDVNKAWADISAAEVPENCDDAIVLNLADFQNKTSDKFTLRHNALTLLVNGPPQGFAADDLAKSSEAQTWICMHHLQ
jgi:hypothetical protein